VNLRDEEDGPPNVDPNWDRARNLNSAIRTTNGVKETDTLLRRAHAYRVEATQRAELARQADRLEVESYADKQARRFWERSPLAALWAWLRGAP